jgi:hypothetical protein
MVSESNNQSVISGWEDFGTWQETSLRDTGGRTDTFFLLEKLPFLAIQPRIENKGRQPLIVTKTPVFCAKYTGSSTEKLRILGTGGLTKAGKSAAICGSPQPIRKAATASSPDFFRPIEAAAWCSPKKKTINFKSRPNLNTVG